MRRYNIYIYIYTYIYCEDGTSCAFSHPSTNTPSHALCLSHCVCLYEVHSVAQQQLAYDMAAIETHAQQTTTEEEEEHAQQTTTPRQIVEKGEEMDF